MREKRVVRSSIFEAYAEHGIGEELKAMWQWVDRHPELLDAVMGDVGNRRDGEGRRRGLPGESVLRCALLKRYWQLSYDELVFFRTDSVSCQAFARLPMGWFPKKTTSHQTISVSSDVTWERINHAFSRGAKVHRIESGPRVRIDSTVTDTPVHAPSDSGLLWGSARPGAVTQRADELLETNGTGLKLNYSNHPRVAKRWMWAIQSARGPAKRAKLYRDLVKVTRKSLCYVACVNETLKCSAIGEIAYLAWWSR